METIKTALGFGSAESQEPVSGQTGAGTATDPYDAGNASEYLCHSKDLLQVSAQTSTDI